jgi:selenocysteine lyase/cysteine desulfurase
VQAHPDPHLGAVRPLVLDERPPTFDGGAYGAWLAGRSPGSVAPGPLQSPGGFHAFEHRWALREAFAFHHAIGRERIAARTSRLATQLKDGLASIDGIRLRTPRDPQLSAGLVCFEHAALDPGDVVDRLRRRHRIVASVTPYATRYVRLGPTIANTPGEIDRVLAAIRRLR